MFLIAVMAFSTMNLYSQTPKNNLKTESMKVLGNCSMCEDRIEKAATSEGAVNPSWDAKTKMLAYSYDAAKTSPDKISKKIAGVGHDAGNYKAEEKVYNSLPSCCKYDRNGSENKNAETHKH